MKIQYVSDLHLEFPENREWLENNPIPVTGNILILAGDIVPLHQRKHYGHFFDTLSSNYEQVYWLPGNHEFYYYDVAPYAHHVCEQIRENVWLVNNASFIHHRIKLIFTTLWGYIQTKEKMIIENHVSDFLLIRYNNSPFTSEHFNELHAIALNFLSHELSEEFETADKKIVVTHHVPTKINYPARYVRSAINPAFAVELKDFILQNKPDYWIYGHHHCNVSDFSLGHTRMLTNQLGYVRYNQHVLFENSKTIRVV